MFNYIIGFLTPSKVDTNILIFSNSAIYQPSLLFFKGFFHRFYHIINQRITKKHKIFFKKKHKNICQFRKRQ